jgi:hypothetical protein
MLETGGICDFCDIFGRFCVCRQVTVISQSFKDKAKRADKWYKTQYFTEKVSRSWVSLCQELLMLETH